MNRTILFLTFLLLSFLSKGQTPHFTNGVVADSKVTLVQNKKDSIKTYGTKTYVYKKKNGDLTEFWVYKQDTSQIYWGYGSGTTKGGKIDGVRVRIFCWHNYSSVVPLYLNDTIYSSDTNKIKPIKIIYK